MSSHVSTIRFRLVLLKAYTHSILEPNRLEMYLAEEVETERASRSVSTDSLAQSIIKIVLIVSCGVGAEGHSINDTKGQSLIRHVSIFLRHLSK